MRLRTVSDIDYLPALDLPTRTAIRRKASGLWTTSPESCSSNGSLREHSYSRFSVEERRGFLSTSAPRPHLRPLDLPLPDQVKGDDQPGP